MRHWITSLGLAIAAALASPAALATNYYLSDCQTGAFRITRERLGKALRIAGLAAEHDGEVLLRRRFDSSKCGYVASLCQRVCGKPGCVARQPLQRSLIQPIDQTQEQAGFFFRQRYQGADRFGRHDGFYK